MTLRVLDRLTSTSESSLVVGDVVEVLGKEEILATLDSSSRLEGLPFMPEMLAYCGKRFRVHKRAHKTCDTVNDYKNRKMRAAVHLEGIRCDGAAHGGCQAGCLIYWKEAWLRKVDDASGPVPSDEAQPIQFHRNAGSGITEADVIAGAYRSTDDNGDVTYVCQATQVPAATQAQGPWEPRQYVEDYTSGNVGLGQIAAGLMFAGYRTVINLGIGVGPALRWLYDAVQGLRGGTPFPLRQGLLAPGSPTPAENLNLQPGELVRVKSYQDILATVDVGLKNRGMHFDKEMVPYCGGVYRVLRRVTSIINERTGKMQTMKTPCIILDAVVCESRYGECRLFCPRAIYPYWREIWLERVEVPEQARERSTPEMAKELAGGVAG